MTKPTPGSDAAISLGCKCPVLDNAHGRGYLGGVKINGQTIFVYSAGCPLHHTPHPASSPATSRAPVISAASGTSAACNAKA